MPIIYRTTPYDDNYLTYLNKLWEDNWIFSGQLWDKLVFRKEVKERKARTVLADDTFDGFWKLYPNKKAKKDALVMWNRLDSKEKTLAVDWLEKYLIYWKKKAIEKQFLPHPATWLNGRRWEDNLSETVQITPIENIEKIRVEEEEERRNEQEKRAMNKRIADIRANPELWESLSNKALALMTEEQKADRGSIVFKSMFDARIRTLITNNN